MPIDNAIESCSRQNRLDTRTPNLETLAASRQELERRVSELLEMNLSLARKLSRRSLKCYSPNVRAACESRGEARAHSDASSDLKSCNEALELIIRYKDTEIKNLTENNRSREVDIFQLREEVYTTRKENQTKEASQQKAIKKLELKNSALRSSVDFYETHVDNMKQQVKDLKCSAAKAASKAEEEKERAEAQLKVGKMKQEVALQKIIELEIKLWNATSESHRLREHNSTRNDIIDQLAQQVNDLRRESIRLSKVEDDVQTVQQRSSESNLDNSGSARNGSLVRNLSFLLDQKTQSLKDIQSECDEARKEVRRYRKKNNQLHGVLSKGINEYNCLLNAYKKRILRQPQSAARVVRTFFANSAR
uniref:Uncharacterized protein n=1 Tax=Odontella aurita TaxID=265563 RepID=A0A7S4NIY6_9STRA|mmetsp:Transcript_9478/g.28470  ORF Transcript_9478/g.28470 Transcript_9478/m.28470 type:complete len:364 (+) Transcript_9478:137-1228(+)